MNFTLRLVLVVGLIAAVAFLFQQFLREKEGRTEAGPPVAEVRLENSDPEVPPYDGMPNRAQPEHADVTMLPEIPADPSDQEIARARVFPRRLVALGGSESENAAFGAFLREARGLDHEALFEAAKAWLAEHPDSRWAPSMRAEVAKGYGKRAWFTLSQSEWQTLWDDYHRNEDQVARGLADEALAALLDDGVAVGDAERLKTLLAECSGRPMAGPIEGTRFRAAQAVQLLERVGAQSVMCGSMALNAIQHHLGNRVIPVSLNTVPASYIATGIPLSEVATWAREHHKLPLAPAKRGAQETRIPLPAVMHAKRDHYAALVDHQDGRYFLVDQSRDFAAWVSEEAVADMASGHFLLPEDKIDGEAFVAMNESDAREVFGRDGAHGIQSPGGSSGPGRPNTRRDPDPNDDEEEEDDDEEDPCKGMPRYTFQSQLAGLIVDDVPLSYSAPIGPQFTSRVVYQDMDSSQPVSPPAYSHIGETWLFGWVGFLVPPEAPLTDSSELLLQDRHGGFEVLAFDSEANIFGPHDASFTTVERISSTQYERTLRSGTVEVYSIPDNPSAPERLFLSSVRDSNGNTLSLSYDSMLRLVSITDAIGQVTTFSHGHPTDDWKITRIRDPFNRTAHFSYNSDGRLSSITDQLGLTTSFSYQADGFMTSMVTPYGRTTFRKLADVSGSSRITEAEDPLGNKERIEFSDPGTPIDSLKPPPTVTVGGETIRFYAEYGRLQFRNTYYWSKEAWHAAPGDYHAARTYRWYTNRSARVGPVLEAYKPALEERVWYVYPGQEATQQGYSFPHYADMGSNPAMTLRMLDKETPQVYQTHRNRVGSIIREVDPLGRSRERVYAANGTDLVEFRQTTGGISERLAAITHDGNGNVLTFTNASNQVSTYTYNSRGKMLTSTTPLGAVTSMTYDANERLMSIDGPLPGAADSHTFTYDSLSRLKTITRPDSYQMTYTYDAMDRVTRRDFPDGTYEEVVYDKLHPVTLRDRSGGVATLVHNALRQPVLYTDWQGREFRFAWCRCGDMKALIDPLGRKTEWVYDVQGRIAAKIYPDGSRVTYDRDPATGQMTRVRRADGQEVQYDRYLDGKPRSIRFAQTTHPTSPVIYTYDAHYGRPETVQDGQGLTSFTYHPVTDSVTTGAMRLASIDGPWANDTVDFTYDAEQRLTGRSINGVMETVIYDHGDRVTDMTNALGSFGITYDGAMNRFTEIALPGGGKTKLGYHGDAGRRLLASIRHEAPDTSLISEYTIDHDANGLVSEWTQEVGGSPVATWDLERDLVGQLTDVSISQSGQPDQTYEYSYDEASNRQSETVNATTTESTYNARNEQIQREDAPQDASYEWDGAGRLLAIQRGTLRSEFEYDASGRRVRVTEKDGATVLSDLRYLWVINQLAEERSADGGTVIRRFYGTGEQDVASGQVSLYLRDHLHSVRQMVSTTGVVSQQVSYDPWGKPSALPGPLPMFGYAGMPYHAPSGLNLATFRAYDPSAGRWISPDPFGERGGFNLYAYAGNQPINKRDPLGLYSGFCASLPSINEFQYHGNWGGPAWSNGGFTGDGPLPNPGDPDYRPPIDAADACYETHDRCFGKCDDCPSDDCLANCDYDVADCVLETGNSFNDPWFQELPDWQKPFVAPLIPLSNIPEYAEAASFDTWIPYFLHSP